MIRMVSFLYITNFGLVIIYSWRVDILAAEDLFCVPVKIGYGKGAVNPVSDSTTFFKPIKHSESVGLNGGSCDHVEIGVLPQGSSQKLI